MKKKIGTFFLGVVIVSVVIGSALVFSIFKAIGDLPSLDALKNYQPPQSTIVYDRNKQVVGRFSDERRIVIPLSSIPEHVKLAFIAAEDAQFYEHTGINYLSLLRALLLEIKYRTIGGRRVGGSTITQQTARTMLLSSTQTYNRKIREMILAHRIEKALSKDQILHLYLNQIYFGNGAYGIEEAALTYFSKHAAKLTLHEAAALASVPKSPHRVNPFGNVERLRSRQHYVLDQMVKNKFIDEKIAAKAKDAKFSDIVEKESRQFAPYFLQSVRSELITIVGEEAIRQGGLKVYSTLDNDMQRHGEHALKEGLQYIDKRGGYRGPLLRPGEDIQKKLIDYLSSYKKRAFVDDNKQKIWDLSLLRSDAVKTSIDSIKDKIRLSKIETNKIIGARVVSVDEKAKKVTIDLGSCQATLPLSSMNWAIQHTPKVQKMSQLLKIGDIVLVKITTAGKEITVALEQEPLINGGLVALDVATGGVLAMVGGYNFDLSPFNRITQAKRQPGSGIKPLVYAEAIADGTTAASIITDAPKAFYDPGTNEYWRPRNHTHKYLGDITVRRCLRSSINTCTISLLEKIGIDRFLRLAKDVELFTTETPFPRNLTIALGSAENYPIDVANAMRILPRLGVYSPYHMIDSLVLSDKKSQMMPEKISKTVLKPEAAYIVANILTEVISYADRTNYLYNVNGDIAGKTGTTNDVRTAMFFGFTSRILALVYVGYDDNRSIGSTEWGVTTAFPIFANFMNKVTKPEHVSHFQQPDGIEWHIIDKNTGRLREEIVEGETISEVFIRGTAPIESVDQTSEIRSVAPVVDDAAFLP